MKSDIPGIFNGAKLENCSFNIQVMNGPVTLRRPQKLKSVKNSDFFLRKPFRELVGIQ